jgi:hypothetical protein
MTNPRKNFENLNTRERIGLLDISAAQRAKALQAARIADKISDVILRGLNGVQHLFASPRC